VTAGTIAAPGEPDDGSTVIDHTPCACGGLAAIVLVEDADGIVCVVRCSCGGFWPAGRVGGGAR
jgi:hypothetical protein